MPAARRFALTAETKRARETRDKSGALERFGRAGETVRAGTLAALVLVHEGVCPANLLLEFFRTGNIDGPHAHREGVGALGAFVARIDELNQALANQKVVHRRGVGQQGAEFVAAEAANDVGLAKALPQ